LSLYFNLAINSWSKIESEVYKEIVGDLNYSTPFTSRPLSLLTISMASKDQFIIQEPMPVDSRGKTAKDTETFSFAVQSTQKYSSELTRRRDSDIPRQRHS